MLARPAPRAAELGEAVRIPLPRLPGGGAESAVQRLRNGSALRNAGSPNPYATPWDHDCRLGCAYCRLMCRRGGWAAALAGECRSPGSTRGRQPSAIAAWIHLRLASSRAPKLP